MLRDSLPSIKSKFIPIKDILTKTYDEKVREYMEQMKDQSLEEVFKAELPKEDKPKAARKLKTLPALAYDMPRPMRILQGKCNSR